MEFQEAVTKAREELQAENTNGEVVESLGIPIGTWNDAIALIVMYGMDHYAGNGYASLVSAIASDSFLVGLLVGKQLDQEVA